MRVWLTLFPLQPICFGLNALNIQNSKNNWINQAYLWERSVKQFSVSRHQAV